MIVVGILLSAAILLWPGGGRLESRSLSAERATRSVRADRIREFLARDHSRDRRTHSWVAEFAEMSAIGLEAGLDPPRAALLACDIGSAGTTPTAYAALRVAVREAQFSGRPLSEALREVQAGLRAQDGPAMDREGVEFLSVAWRLADELGVPAAYAAQTCARVLREREAARDRQQAIAAGPRTSMWLLTLLPLVGPLVSVVLGLPVIEVYSTPAALAGSIVGVGLAGAGWLWSRRVLDRAVQPAVLT